MRLWVKNCGRIGGQHAEGPAIRGAGPFASALAILAVGLVGAHCGAPARAPTIGEQPVSLTVTTCQAATFTVVAGGTPPLVYAWTKDGAAVTGAAGGTLTIAAALPSDAGSYQVVVSNREGMAVSAVATLGVGPAGPPSSSPQVVASEGGNTVVRVGDTLAWASAAGYVDATSAICPGAIRRIYEGGTQPAGLITDGTSLFWIDEIPGGSGLFTAAPGGTGGRVLANTAAQYGGLTVVGPLLVWTDVNRGRIQTLPITGGNVTSYSTAFSSSQDWPTGITGDGKNYYWADATSTQPGLIRKMTPGGAMSTLASGQGIVSAVATDGQDVFWVSTLGTSSDSSTAVRKVGVSGGNVVELASLPSTNFGGIVLDGGFVYWSALSLSGSQASTGAISRVPKDGSALATVLVSGLGCPGGLFADQEYVYWAESSLGSACVTDRIMRLAK